MRTVEAFEEICRRLPYRRKGMFYSEVFLFLQACARQEVQIIIESGVKLGMSTALLRAGFDGELISIEISGAPPAIEGVDFIQGDSRKVIPRVLAESIGSRIAILIDGPKGAAALDMMWDLMCWPSIRLIGIHDLPSGSMGRAQTSHSHDVAFRRTFGDRLDDLIQHEYRDKYPKGPGLAIWEKSL